MMQLFYSQCTASRRLAYLPAQFIQLQALFTGYHSMVIVMRPGSDEQYPPLRARIKLPPGRLLHRCKTILEKDNLRKSRFIGPFHDGLLSRTYTWRHQHRALLRKRHDPVTFTDDFLR